MAGLLLVSLSAQAVVSEFELLPAWRGLHIAPKLAGEGQTVVPKKGWKLDSLKNNTYTYINTDIPTQPKVFIEFDKNTRDVKTVAEVDKFSVSYENKDRIVYCISPLAFDTSVTLCEINEITFCPKLQKLYQKLGESHLKKCVSDIGNIYNTIASSRDGRLSSQDRAMITKYKEMAGKDYGQGVDLKTAISKSALPYDTSSAHPLLPFFQALKICEARGFQFDTQDKLAPKKSEGEPAAKNNGGSKRTIQR